MKKGIHPKYYSDAKVHCASCGNTFATGSTTKEISVEICAACHPFFTGKQKYIDTAGRVDRFKKIAEQAKMKKGNRLTKREKSKIRKAKKEPKAEKEESPAVEVARRESKRISRPRARKAKRSDS